MARFKLHHGDCLEVLRGMPDDSIDAIVTDPPYGLSFMGKKWDYDVPSVEVWGECLRVLKPGGHLLAFAGTRTQHRMAVRIEDAGFEIRDMIAWVYGSGFPKSLDVSKAIDKAAGAEREVVGERKKLQSYGADVNDVYGSGPDKGGVQLITAPATDAARQWQGWGTALKPALEPITVARKPLGTCATNVLQMVESQLRERGVRGEILWKPENASGAARSKKTTSSGSTRPLEASETFAKNADESVTRSVEQQSLKSSEKHGTSGLNQTPDGSASFQGCTTSACANPSSQPTAESAPAAESKSATSSPLTTSTAAELNTGSRSTEKCTPNYGATDSLPDTESFAGIATGLTGSMATVRINRDSQGFFLWPRGLPEFVPGSPLTVAANVLEHGTGALNIDGCRVGSDVVGWGGARGGSDDSTQSQGRNYRLGEGAARPVEGRWPANILHDGSDEVLAGFPTSASPWIGNPNTGAKGGKMFGGADQAINEKPEYRDSGSAARFFYCAKASKRDRDEGLEGFEVRPTAAMAGNMVDGQRLSGTGQPIATPTRANHHPTVKPTDLMRYLCRLVTPPGGVVLDPFMGSGSTGKAAMLEGFRFIGCELSPEYLAIAEARISAVAPEVRSVDDLI